MAVYTPGASHGLPLAVLRSLAAPPAGLEVDADAKRERVTSTVSALLALAGEDADPLQSREHILLSHIVERAWDDGLDLDLEAVIRAVQSPGFDRVGVLDLDSFYPEKQRFELAMKLNNLLAAPGFEAWLEGEPLDIRSLLWTADGKPRISIISIAHLGEAERMFLVTLVLNELLAWIRTRPGTSSLRAILYMDEVFGYLPPSKIPPSKQPLLTMLKQARAYGLGVVLATQNPVDLDYKALSNAGTWFLGRLQTERDKNRIMDGLEGAAAFAESGLDRAEMDRILGGLQSRTFLLNNVHEDGPVLFRTRWALSYLRGPMARPEIRRLMEPRRDPGLRLEDSETAAAMPRSGTAVPPADSVEPAAIEIERPVVSPGVEEVFVTPMAGREAVGPYRPALLAEVDLHYARSALGLDEWKREVCVALLPADVPPNPWEEAETYAALDLSAEPDPELEFGKLPGAAARPASYRAWKSALKGYLYKNRPLELYRCAALKLVSEAGESDADFRVRLREAARDARDEEVEKLRDKFATRLARIDARIGKAVERVEREESQYSQQRMQTAISVGATVLDAFLGRKKLSRRSMGRATTAMRGAGRVSRERDDMRRAAESVDVLRDRRAEMEQEFARETEAVRERFDVEGLQLETVAIAPRKADVNIQRVALAWLPGDLPT
jgi:hypothetical protein